MAYKVFANGYPLLASELNNYLMNQSVISFANAAERDATLTSPVSGQLVWLVDSGAYYKYSGSAWTELLGATPVSEESSSFTITADQANGYVYVTNTATITIDDVLAVGDTINFIATTANVVDFAAGSGVTLNSKDAKLLLSGQYAGASITKKAANTYFLVGDLA